MLDIVVLIFTHMFVACLFWAIGYDQGRDMGKRLEHFKQFDEAWDKAKMEAIEKVWGGK